MLETIKVLYRPNFNNSLGALKKANSFVCKTEAGKSVVGTATFHLDLRKALKAENFPQVSVILLKVQKRAKQVGRGEGEGRGEKSLVAIDIPGLGK
jgi:hypothetical protein